MDDVKIGEILLPGEEADTEKRASKVKARFWPTFRRAFRQLPLQPAQPGRNPGLAHADHCAAWQRFGVGSAAGRNTAVVMG